MVEEILFALFIAAFLSFIFWIVFKTTKGNWPHIGIFFLVLFLAVWAGTLWLIPEGPYSWGAAWIPILCIGLILALMLAISVPAHLKRAARLSGVSDEEVETETKSAKVTGIFLWLLIAGLITAIIAGYIIPG